MNRSMSLKFWIIGFTIHNWKLYSHIQAFDELIPVLMLHQSYVSLLKLNYVYFLLEKNLLRFTFHRFFFHFFSQIFNGEDPNTRASVSGRIVDSTVTSSTDVLPSLGQFLSFASKPIHHT